MYPPLWAFSVSLGKRICLQCMRHRFNSWVRKIPWRWEWLPTPVFLPGESHGQRSLIGHSPWSHRESDTAERLCISSIIIESSLAALKILCAPPTHPALPNLWIPLIFSCPCNFVFLQSVIVRII